ncbi:MAG: right-handed parallel beta-helix repeat-containing protein [Planctomycetia bacterium]|nr:right-handed parallel beta-helix repeat-containing protein [Planctomycetia bacterium]
MSNVRQFGAVGDGRRDDIEAIEHALRDGDGLLEFPPGTYRITRPIVVRLKDKGPAAVRGSGGIAKLVMAGPGPALAFEATHSTTADPTGFRPEEWARERMPTVADIEIQGAHPEADGIRIVGVMQPTLTGVLIREVQTAVSIHQRARNVLISHCHIYNNKKVGIHLDRVDLHQTIITGSHISYCRLGGIRIEASEIRNLQITGNDIEYNNNRSHKVPGADGEPTAEIYIDCRTGSVREGTIASNTIQATYSPGGANIRIIGNSPEKNHKAGLWTIAGNLIGSQENNIHLTSVRGMAISGNVIYSGHSRNLLIESSRNIAVGANVFDHNPDYEPKELCTGIRLVDCVDCSLSGLVIQDCQAGKHTVTEAGSQQREGLVELVRCRRMSLSGVQIIDPAPCGLFLDECSDTLVSGCTILDGRSPALMQAAVRWQGSGTGNLVANCRLGKGTAGAIVAESHVRDWNNLVAPAMPS